MIKKIDHIMFWSKDLDVTKKWYQEKFGFQVGYHAPNEFLILNHDEMGRVDFHATDDESQIGKGLLPYFMVDNIEEVKVWLEKKDVKVSDIQQEGDSPKHAWFNDCDGNAFGLEEV